MTLKSGAQKSGDHRRESEHRAGGFGNHAPRGNCLAPLSGCLRSLTDCLLPLSRHHRSLSGCLQPPIDSLKRGFKGVE